MKILSIFIIGIVAVSAFSEVETQFQAFLTKYNKEYKCPKEYAKRLGIFTHNLATIERMNQKEKNAQFGVTKFADLSNQEFRETVLMKNKIPRNRGPKESSLNLAPVDLPISFDWRDKNAVTPVKDQGQCGSCWAFSATEAVESQWFLAGNKLPVLAPQQIVDCDQGRGDQGCNGGDTPTAYQYVMAAGGMESESAYPYQGEDDTCTFDKTKVIAKISNWTYAINNTDENAMKQALFQKGPLSICVDASPWQFYFGGVLNALCSGSESDLDHCVMVTGFQDDYETWYFETVKIWKIRNSWGPDWGEDGYIYIEQGYNLCGVADEVTLPIV